jgi:hypothetical protein
MLAKLELFGGSFSGFRGSLHVSESLASESGSVLSGVMLPEHGCHGGTSDSEPARRTAAATVTPLPAAARPGRRRGGCGYSDGPWRRRRL